MNNTDADFALLATPSIDAIRAATATIEKAGLDTPSLHADTLSRLSGAKVILKLENLQPTGSFKVRGSLIKIDGLDPVRKRLFPLTQAPVDLCSRYS